jgi:mannose-6-phosphate isomerase-like protein (cupin superfamily)
MHAKWLTCIVIGTALCSLTPARGAPPAPVLRHRTPIDSFNRWSDWDLAAMPKAPHFSVYLSDHENFFLEEAIRDTSSGIAEHDHWNEYLVIQQGDGTLTYGGKMIGGKPDALGDWHDGKMVGGMTRELHPGVLVAIPAGTPYQIVLPPGKTLRHLVIKSRR